MLLYWCGASAQSIWVDDIKGHPFHITGKVKKNLLLGKITNLADTIKLHAKDTVLLHKGELTCKIVGKKEEVISKLNWTKNEESTFKKYTSYIAAFFGYNENTESIDNNQVKNTGISRDKGLTKIIFPLESNIGSHEDLVFIWPNIKHDNMTIQITDSKGKVVVEKEVEEAYHINDNSFFVFKNEVAYSDSIKVKIQNRQSGIWSRAVCLTISENAIDDECKALSNESMGQLLCIIEEAKNNHHLNQALLEFVPNRDLLYDAEVLRLVQYLYDVPLNSEK
jgi:hypothetical protein